MDDAVKLQKLFQVLGDSNRLKIIKFLHGKEFSVSQIVEETELSQPLVSHHLKLLREVRILESKRKGPFVFHRLANENLIDALGVFLEIVHLINNEKVDDPMFSVPEWWDSDKLNQ